MIRKNVLISYSTEAVNLTASLFFVGYFIRSYSTSIYGDFIVLTSLISFLTLYNFGVDSTLKAEYGKKESTPDRLLILFRSLTTITIFGLAALSIAILLLTLQSNSIINNDIFLLAINYDFYILGSICLIFFSIIQAHILLSVNFLLERTYNSAINLTSLAATFLAAQFTIIIRSALSNQDVGTYSLIFRFITLGFFLPTAICTAITPNLSKFSANNSHHELTSLYQSTFHTLLIIFLLFAFPVIFFLDFIINNWIGHELVTSVAVRFILLGWAGLMFINSLNTSIIILTGSANFFLVLVLFAEALLHVTLSLILVNKFHLEGIAFSALISLALTTLPFQFHLIKNKLKIYEREKLFRDIIFSIILYTISLITIFISYHHFKNATMSVILFISFTLFCTTRYIKHGHLTRLLG